MEDKIKKLEEKIDSVIEDKVNNVLKSKKLEIEKSEVKEIITELVGDLDERISNIVKKHYDLFLELFLNKDESKNEGD